MSDETEKAGYPEETTATEEQSPLERTMMSLHASIEVAAVISEKLSAALQPVLCDPIPTPDNNRDGLAVVDVSSAHVRDVSKAQRQVMEIADRLRSLLERVEV